jgi:site-specific recombinase XerD
VTEPITPTGVAHICTQAGHAAKLKKAVYPHLLRHYAAFRVMLGDEQTTSNDARYTLLYAA